MTLSVGRATLDNTYGDQTYAIRQNGDELRLSGTLWPDTAPTDTRLAFQQQWLGLLDGDIVPVIDSERYELTGMYAVAGQPTINYVPATSSTSGHLDVTARLVRLGRGFGSPAFEVVYNTTDTYRPNNQITGSPASNSADGWVWDTVSYKELSHSVANEQAIEGTTAVTSRVWRGSDAANGVVPFGAPVADYYIGAATVLQDGNAVQGRQIWVDPTEANPERTITLSNGVVRFGIVDTADNNEFYVQRWTGSAWGVQHAFEITVLNQPSYAFANVLPRILRNTPETVVVEWVLSEADGGGNTTATFQVALRRGSRHVEMYAAPITITGFSLELDVQWVGAGALSTIEYTTIPNVTSYGNNIRATSDDADGNRVCMFAPYQVTSGFSTTGLLETEGDDNNVTQLAIGVDTLALSPNVLAEYYHPTSERQVVVW